MFDVMQFADDSMLFFLQLQQNEWFGLMIKKKLDQKLDCN